MSYITKKEGIVKKIKAISTNAYSVEMFEDARGLYRVVATNTATGTVKEISMADFNLANYAFDSKFNEFEGSLI